MAMMSLLDFNVENNLHSNFGLVSVCWCRFEMIAEVVGEETKGSERRREKTY